MTTYPSEYGPPPGTRYFSFRLTKDDGRHEVSVGYLSREELFWVARVISAELTARRKRKQNGSQNVSGVVN